MEALITMRVDQEFDKLMATEYKSNEADYANKHLNEYNDRHVGDLHPKIDICN